MKQFIAVVMCLFVFSISYAQITLVKSSQSQHFQNALELYSNTVELDKDNVLVIGEKPEETGGRLIDAWDDNFLYYIMYPEEPENYAALSRYGNVVFDHKGILLLKAKEMIESEEIMRAYDLYLLQNKSYRLEKPVAAPRVNYTYDQDIAKIVAKVSGDSIWNNDFILEHLSRPNTASTAQKATEWVTNYFKAYCPTVVVQTWRSGVPPNIIAIKKGKTNPDEYIVICGHYDSTGPNDPAADDNGSGTCCTMEACRVLSSYEFKRSLIFIAFSGEELGLQGSGKYCDSIKKANTNVITTLNMDMVFYQGKGPFDTFVITQALGNGLKAEYKDIAKIYTPELAVKDPTGGTGSSDQASFLRNGYKAIQLLEAGNKTVNGDSYWNPNYHKKGDSLQEGYSRDLVKQVTMGQLALMITKAELLGTSIKQEQLAAKHGTVAVTLTGNRHMTLNVPFMKQGSVYLYTMKGRLVSSFRLTGSQSQPVHLPELAAGIYQLRVSDGTTVLHQKVTIAR